MSVAKNGALLWDQVQESRDSQQNVQPSFHEAINSYNTNPMRHEAINSYNTNRMRHDVATTMEKIREGLTKQAEERKPKNSPVRF